MKKLKEGAKNVSEPPLKITKGLVFSLALSLSIVWAGVVDGIFKFAFPPEPWYGFLFLTAPMKWFFIACVLAPISEELLFRVAPIKAMQARNWSKDAIIWTMFIISMIFGLYHAADYYHMFVQGAVGFIFTFHYLINKSFWLNVLLHASYNVLATLLLS